MIYDLLQLNNQYYELDGLVDATTLNETPPTYINNATGTVKILDSTGATIESAALLYVAGSNGVYRGFITGFDDALGRGYTIVVDLTTPGGGVYHRELLAESVIARGN